VDAMRTVLELRPPNALARLGDDSRVCLLNGKDVIRVLREDPVIIMACNARIKHVIPGIMRAAEDLDAAICFEIAKSEGDLDGGYTGMDPRAYWETVVGYAEEVQFTRPFFIHRDHTQVKSTSTEAVESARRILDVSLKEGYTSFSIDASFNELPDNIRITKDLARPIDLAGLGLEVEVGEIKSAGSEGAITTVEEAETYIRALTDDGLHPDLLAINNGSKHGNYLPGEEVHIDLARTLEIYNVVREYGVCIAQHGITGTPPRLIGQFADNGIRKGNVATQWQNICHELFPEELERDIQTWVRTTKKDIKNATREFKGRIDSIPAESAKAIADRAYREAREMLVHFRAPGTGTKVIERLAEGL
jgi:fructose-bisphosphate aldolase, class II